MVEHEFHLSAQVQKGNRSRQTFLDPALAKRGFLPGPLRLKGAPVNKQTGPVAGTLDINLLADFQVIEERKRSLAQRGAYLSPSTSESCP